MTVASYKLIFISILSIQVVIVLGGECYIESDKEAQAIWKAANEKCLSEAKSLPDAKLYPMINSSMAEFDFDDKCTTRCVYKEAKIITPEGLPMKDEMIPFKANHTAEMESKLKSNWNACIDQSVKIAKEKKFPEDNCKLFGLHNFCVTQTFISQKIYQDC